MYKVKTSGWHGWILLKSCLKIIMQLSQWQIECGCKNDGLSTGHHTPGQLLHICNMILDFKPLPCGDKLSFLTTHICLPFRMKLL